MHEAIEWSFPLPRPHAGVPLGNGTQGLMIWGEEAAAGGRWEVCITVGRAGFWDHRGGVPFATGVTYGKVRTWLEAGDLERIQAAFAAARSVPFGPQQLGGGRVVLTLPRGWRPMEAAFNPDRGGVRVTLQSGVEDQRVQADLWIGQSAGDAARQDLAWVHIGEAVREGLDVAVVSSFDLCPRQWQARGIEPPRRLEGELGEGRVLGFEQTLPGDAPLALAVRAEPGGAGALGVLVIATALGDDAADRAVEEARLDTAALLEIEETSSRWWSEYFSGLPTLDFPDAILRRAYRVGLLKLAGCTAPLGVASGLQGPFLEDYQHPPWAADYHFNINEQMIYWPALLTGRAEHLDPMWRMIRSWWPRLEQNAASFFELDPGKHAVMLPHAVDDRCHVVGSFWTGAFDHGCTAWMAVMANLHARYSGDVTIRDEVAVPLLKGAFEGYWAMMEGTDATQGTPLSLPVSVSPEWRGARVDAWGRDASFQLAACHAVVDALIERAEEGEIQRDEAWGRWVRVRRDLPPYTTVLGPMRLEHPEHVVERIGLWEGMDLVESHRHHSHLASIYPFDTIDPFDEAHRQVVRASLGQWTLQGPGAWSGWCVPWAATLHARVNGADAAVAWLHLWHDVFTNVGGGTLHDGDFAGVTTLAPPPMPRDASRDSGQLTALANRGGEVMQMDAAMGAVTAILELFVQCRRRDIDSGLRRSVIHILPTIPRGWRDATFAGIHAEGGFILGGEVRDGRLVRVSVQSPRGGTLRIAVGGPTAAGFETYETHAGQTLTLQPGGNG